MWYYGMIDGLNCEAEIVSENRAIVIAVESGKEHTANGWSAIWKSLNEHEQWIIDLKTGQRVDTL